MILSRASRRAAALRLAFGLASLVLPLAAPAQPAAALPGDSVYQLPVTLTDQSGHSAPWAARRGSPQVVAMFYTNCAYVCPMTIDTLRHVVQSLPAAERARLKLLIVSIDPARDSVARLRQVSRERHLDGAQWTLARTDAAGVRSIAAVLGVQYRRLPDGEFNHSTVLTLLDADGRIVAQTSQIGDPDPAFEGAVQAAVSATH
ncbi:MAG: SCO family protein [Betaproteobacteria bacterium]|nr:SCO family protein [Betaproteobacteria bacterium]